MYGAIRKYRVSDAGELFRRVEDEFVPMVRDVPGFVAYYVIDGGDGTAASVTICRDEAGVEESTARATEWARTSASDLVDGSPEVTTGEVVVEYSQMSAGV